MSTESNKITKRRDAETASRVLKTSRIVTKNPRSIYRVIAGEQENELVLRVYMAIQEHEEYIETLLAQAVKKAVPFHTPNRLQ